jgi:hypothetical protein
MEVGRTDTFIHVMRKRCIVTQIAFSPRARPPVSYPSVHSHCAYSVRAVVFSFASQLYIFVFMHAYVVKNNSIRLINIKSRLLQHDRPPSIVWPLRELAMKPVVDAGGGRLQGCEV